MPDRKVIFPCDHKSWPDVKTTLMLAKSSCGLESWLGAFQKAHDLIHSDVASASVELNLGAKSKTRNIFAGLRMFFDSESAATESYKCIDHIFPVIVDLILEIEKLKPNHGLELLCRLREGSCTISRRLAASIVACEFLCLFPGRCPALGICSRLNACSFDDFFHHLDSEYQCEKLRCILRYFSTVFELHSMSLENLIFSRKVLGYDRVPKLDDWLCSTHPLCPVVVLVSGQPTVTGNKLQVIFGNRRYGGRALGVGQSQEDRLFFEDVELISGILFIESLAENEALIIRGSVAVNSSPSRLTSATTSSSSEDLMPQVEIDSGTDICFIDPPMSSSSSTTGQPFKQQSIHGLLSKMLTGFKLESQCTSRSMPFENLAVASGSSDEATVHTECSSALGDDVNEKTNETDLSSDSGSSELHMQRTRPSSSSLENEFLSRIALRRAKQAKAMSSWHSNSSTESSGSFSDSLSRAMSLEVDSSSACHTPDETSIAMLLHQRSSALHSSSSSSSRRGSTLQWQSSFASEAGDAPGYSGYGRRRSSGMSDVSRRSSSSSSSSAGKRRSTDYSSEMEEYCENFQRSIIKTSVIEEESGAMALQEDEVAGAAAGIFGSVAPGGSNTDHVKYVRSKMLQKFSKDHPKNVAKPTPIRVSAATPFFPNAVPTAGHQTALDHFVDNLINEVAQDSKIEIEELVREQHMKQLCGQNSAGEPGSSRWPLCLNPNLSQSDSASTRIERVGLPGRNIDGWSESGSKNIEGVQNQSPSLSRLKSCKAGYPLLAKTDRPSETKFPQTRKHCHSCDQFTEDVDEFVTDFLNNVFTEAIDVYHRHFLSSSDDSKRQSLVEELWVAPSSASTRLHQTVSSLASLKLSDDIESGDRKSSGNKRQRPFGLFYSQSCDDGQFLRPRNALSRSSSLLSSNSGRKQTAGQTPPEFSKQGGRVRDISQSTPSISQLWSNPTSREYLLSWFNSSTSLYVEKPTTSLDWFAQDLLVDAFDNAFVDLFGKAFLQESVQKLCANTCSEFVQSNRSSENVEKSTRRLSSYAENLAQAVLSVGSREAALHLSASGSHGYCNVDPTKKVSGMCFGQKPSTSTAKMSIELEQIANDFAHQLIEEAVQLVAGPGSVKKNEQSIITRHCYVGVYRNEPQLFALIQWIAASMAQTSELHYHTHGNTQISQMDVICQIVRSRQLTVGLLLTEIFAWCKQKNSRPSDVESLFDFLLIRLT